MSRMVNCGFGVVLALTLSVAAQAQSRGLHSRSFGSSLATRARMVRASPIQTNASLTDSSVFVLNGPVFTSFDTLLLGSFPVPGLGFDFAHLAAITRNIKVSDLSVLSTPQRLALARSLTPAVSFAVPFFATPQVVVVQQPPVVVVQQPFAPEEAVAPAGRAPYVEPKESVQPTPATEPTRDVGEFVLVRRDGRVVFAVAFSTEGDRLTYITREGIRRSLPLAELDIDATRRMNEERGTTLHLPV